MNTTFKNLGLLPELLKTVELCGYASPTPIQEASFAIIEKGGDILAAAQTGTGKTAAFILPLLQQILQSPTVYQKCAPRFLILTPTRELAMQVFESIQSLKGDLPIKAAVVFGGVGINPQKAAVAKGLDFLVATPGRLLDLMRQRYADISQTECLILDEADRMLDLGFMPSLKNIIKKLPTERQTLLFSATFSPDIKKLAEDFLTDPKVIEIEHNQDNHLVRQVLYKVPKSAKSVVLRDLIVDNQWRQVLVFTRTKQTADKLCKSLELDGFNVRSIHGDKSQAARSKSLAEFKDRKLQVLVATDVAARGLDIEKLPQVVNYELPEQIEDYVHRIGRTGRAGESGDAVSLVCSDELYKLHEIEKFLGHELPLEQVKGLPYGLYADEEKQERPSRNDRSRNSPRKSTGGKTKSLSGFKSASRSAYRMNRNPENGSHKSEASPKNRSRFRP